ncbi:MAG TPA: polyphosphate:AMP phosphotransferase [Candidatus Avacidaminococcus intestinavium]|uniref:Polyphosphate:AMP phosphotransferase n=1 Tax=Candidatus Avacidaminococcus intestinavium TaxID=2840684 RepID=A0A9D1MNR2_9FIRM|nr:polyphosphate:AMP phosphotransferase [Candidatus Avacidaminococcus intestinavium]
MLNLVDLTTRCIKSEYEKKIDQYSEQMGALQRKLRSEKIPVILVFEGWHGSMRGSLINRFIASMDPRGYSVQSSSKKDQQQESKPYFLNYWQALPAKGSIAVYDNGWYYHKLEAEVADKKAVKNISYSDINFFEKELTDDGYLVIKVFLHISHEQQKKNLDKIEKNLGKDWEKLLAYKGRSHSYDDYFKEYEEMLSKTDKLHAKWHILSAEDDDYALLKLFEVVFSCVNEHLAMLHFDTESKSVSSSPAVPDILSKLDLALTCEENVYKEEIKEKQKYLRKLQYEMYTKKIPTAILFEGCDAAGKGGAIRRLTKYLHPLAYRVVPVAAPNLIEQQFHYLWRFWRNLPPAGEMIIFDRTWYGRVLVERVEHFAKPKEWARAYEEINDLEKQWSEHGVTIIKFWLQIDQDEQLARFKEREANPDKNWKITEEDWRNRDKWEDYKPAINEMLFRTDSKYASWTIVEANSKYYARLKVLTTVIAAFEKALQK